MERPTKFLLIAGGLLMGSSLLTRYFFSIPADLDDFLKGLGVAFVISSLFVQRKWERRREAGPKGQ